MALPQSGRGRPSGMTAGVSGQATPTPPPGVSSPGTIRITVRVSLLATSADLQRGRGQSAVTHPSESGPDPRTVLLHRAASGGVQLCGLGAKATDPPVLKNRFPVELNETQE
ncbi:hypothetical protein AAFF_G00075920 [Aldrovandia affinis]|uniref:Uncharacterized protein n=1 Tax=Aldrovandia affinis TaxID=143900 RepID=A0AAD7RYC4_9TELE|nr:hypothetical protein AAFF_G00075920 [Aldrovandia affinis]